MTTLVVAVRLGDRGIRPEGARTDAELLSLVAAAEQYSSHVLAASLVGEAQKRALALPDVSHAREEASRTLQELRKLGIQNTLMITGDVAQTAHTVAEELHLSEVHAECLPEDKVRLVHATTPRPVVMVGDGVNDAPVLGPPMRASHWDS